MTHWFTVEGETLRVLASDACPPRASAARSIALGMAYDKASPKLLQAELPNGTLGSDHQGMLTGKELGLAIARAIELKGVSKAEVARHFGVREPSIQDWVKRGTIDKGKLPALWMYFSDAVDMAHWGVTSMPALPDSQVKKAGKKDVFNDLTAAEKKMLTDFRAMMDEDRTEISIEIAKRADKARHFVAQVLANYTPKKQAKEKA